MLANCSFSIKNSLKLVAVTSLVLCFYLIYIFQQRSKEETNHSTYQKVSTTQPTINNTSYNRDQVVYLNNTNSSSKILHKDPSTLYFTPSNEWLYLSINSHSGNIRQIQQISQLLQHHSMFLKKNTFLVIDKPFSADIDNTQFNSFLIHNWPQSEIKGTDGYSQAQYRFLYAMKYILQIQEERKDTVVRWFMLCDDDAFLIPKNVLRVVGKYELKIREGKLDRNLPIIIGETVNCDHILGGSTVILNRKAIELVLKYKDECIALFGLQYYDLTLFNCWKQVILPKEYNNASKQLLCQVLQDEPSFNCCNFRLFCDYRIIGVFDSNSWYDRFRQIATLHYIKNADYSILRSILPDDFFKPPKKSFSFTKQELETGFPSLALPSTLNKEQISELTLRELVNQFVMNQKLLIDLNSQYTIQAQMETIHEFIFNHWNDESYSKRIRENPVKENLKLSENIELLIIPSYNFEKFHIDNNDTQLYLNQGSKYHTNQHLSKINNCINGLYECVNGISIASNLTKWVIIGTETTRINAGKLMNYLKTFDSNGVWFVGGFVVVQDHLMTTASTSPTDITNDNISIPPPIGSGIVLSRKFIEMFQQQVKLMNTATRAFHKLLSPTSMALSSDMFFSHTQEYYCVQGITNPLAWIEMKAKTSELEPTVVTIKPEKNCFTSWTNVNHFFTKTHASSTIYPGYEYKYAPCIH